MKRILFVIVLLAVILLTTTTASAKTDRIYFTGYDDCPDTLTFVREWLSGPNYHVSGIMQTCQDTASITQLVGIEYLSDSNLQLVGPNFIITGKDRMVTDEGGVWVGSWVLPANSDTIRIVMQGEGLYAGQQVHIFLNVLDNTFWGYILTSGD